MWYIIEMYSPGILMFLPFWLLNSLKCSSINWDVLMIYHDHDKDIITLILFRTIYESHCYLIDLIWYPVKEAWEQSRHLTGIKEKGYYSYELFNWILTLFIYCSCSISFVLINMSNKHMGWSFLFFSRSAHDRLVILRTR